MFIAIKDTKIIAIYDSELGCRRKAKGLSKIDFNTWVDSVTTEGVPDFSGEDYEIVETDSPLSYESTDEDGVTRIISFNESGHITTNLEGTHYHLTWNGSEIVKDDTAKAAYDLAEEWKQIRTERNRLLAETDWVVIKARENGGQVAEKWKTYRVGLRNIPSEQSDATKYSEITWPTRPE